MTYSQTIDKINSAILVADDFYHSIDTTSNEGMLLGCVVSIAKNSLKKNSLNYWDEYHNENNQPALLSVWVGIDLLGILGGIATQIASDLYDGHSIDWAKAFLVGAISAIFASIGGSSWFLKLFKSANVI